MMLLVCFLDCVFRKGFILRKGSIRCYVYLLLSIYNIGLNVFWLIRTKCSLNITLRNSLLSQSVKVL